MRSIRRLKAGSIFLIVLMVFILPVEAQAGNIILFRDEESLTLYISPSVSVAGLRFGVTYPDGTSFNTALNSYPSFIGLPTSLAAPLCIRLRVGNSVPPLECLNVATAEQLLNRANVFWYDRASASFLNITIYSENTAVGFCPSGDDNGCPMIYTPPAATLTPTLIPRPPTFTPPPTRIPFTLTPTFTATLASSAAFGMSLDNPVLHNADWIPFVDQYARTFDGVEMVLVPAGRFMMGSGADQIDAAMLFCTGAGADEGAICERDWFTDEMPRHPQEIAVPFYIDRTEVTRAQYQQCVDDGECAIEENSTFSRQPNQPINRVTWFQARDYCEWRGARLPTEAEWEYAASGVDSLIFPWGNEPDGARANHCDRNCGNAPWASGSTYRYVNEEHDDGYAITAPVAHYSNISWVGAYDLAGNVWEWTSSLHVDYPYTVNSEDENNATTERVVRGGSFLNAFDAMRAAHRSGFLRDTEAGDGGIRCVRDFE